MKRGSINAPSLSPCSGKEPYNSFEIHGDQTVDLTSSHSTNNQKLFVSLLMGSAAKKLNIVS